MLGEDTARVPVGTQPSQAHSGEGPGAAGFAQFLADVTPFFYRRALTYVDLGAFDGALFTMLQASRLSIRDAHLVEPNPTTFKKLQESVSPRKSTESVSLYNLAISDKVGSVRMQAANTMTRVIDETCPHETNSPRNSNSFDVDCTTLDELAQLLLNQHISILKIDVEGHEQRVLRGAGQLLSKEAIDVVYVEAGADPNAKQQCYYRLIDDEMMRHGYRLFRIYEQTHEWTEDLPTLRRMNIAYMSPSFANNNPYRLSQELLAAHDEIETMARNIDKGAKQLELAKAEVTRQSVELSQREGQIVHLENDLTHALSEIERLTDQVTQAHSKINDFSAKLAQVSQLASEREVAIERLRAETLDLATQLRDAEAAANATSSLQNRLAAMEASTSWRLTAPIRDLKGSVARLLRGARLPLSASAAPPRKIAAPSPRAQTANASQALAPPNQSAKAYEDKLWAGFSRRALRDLEALKASGDPQQSAAAAWALACWFAAEGDLKTALANVSHSRGSSNAKRAKALLEAYCLVRLGRRAQAQEALANAAAQFPEDQDVQFAVANALDNDGERLARVNAVLARANLAPLQMVDAARGLSVDNLSAPAPPAPDASRAKVTVIVPVFNGAATVGFALEGLLTQTWGNLEIIAVDDCSTDESAVVLRAFAARDNRINVITQNKNQGTYSARNRALAASTGDFITVHDANDWSHPQKIELQARDLLENERIAGNFSNWARVIDDLVFVGKFRRKDRIVDWNPSSFMFRRALLDKVGGWDEVRISADAELVRRAREAVAGSQEVRAIPTAAPLAFAYDDAASLTKHSATHGRTIFHGVRREYKEASAYWHSVATRDEQRLSPGARPFPAPGPIRSDKENHAECDLLLIADFSAAGLDGALALTDADVAIAEGQRVAVFNWRAYDDNPTTTLPLPLRQRAHEGKLRVIAPGEAVAAERVVIGNPIVLQEMVDIAPKIISFNSLRVMADRADASLDKARVLAHLDEIFGQPGDWG